MPSRPAPGPTQSPTQWIPGAPPPLQLVTRSRKRGSIQPLPHTPSWPRQLYLSWFFFLLADSY
jgi:hypothetical protein